VHITFSNFSISNTSKKLFFFISIKDSIHNDATAQTISDKVSKEGWILKKGNRKMQGYAKRWMKVDIDGILSYSENPGGYINLKL
jgi:hypothetical protein